ncbi:methyltransferase domain-containing protein [Treponema sp. OMZ 305]|uniref:class I SAM-dependent methyltransferase n=1 Tax=Treponema sp. OMZ 305 TaxID=1659192 RepID=UPI0020A2BBFC|nr:methyltransferase domain-containing protein [Treponema sp. OMZ 305]UTC57239.1 methyltransferase domain-containing protein [Treponema sp. OMZ 305]
MNVYDLIADHYSELFPVEAEKLDFIQHLCPLPGRLCDAGCATGDLALGLHQRGYDIYGLDLNAKMIGIAEQKAAHTFGIRTSGELAFHRANIADILQFGTCNGVLCFGNTLPHLPDEAALRRFFSSVYQSLQGYGIFIVEVLNYDRILAEKKMNFKDKETDAFIFKRRYDFLPDGNIKFTIEFTDKTHDTIDSDFTVLHPLQRQTLLTLFEQTGFQSAAAYSDYSFTESRAEDYAVVYVEKKCILKDA